MKTGDTFLFLDGSDDHLWMIISNTTDIKEVVIVRFLSWESNYDQACTVYVGEHPFIKHPTCVNYSAAMVAPLAALETLRDSGKLKLRQPLSDELLAKILSTVMDSDIPTKCITILSDQGLIDYP